VLFRGIPLTARIPVSRVLFKSR